MTSKSSGMRCLSIRQPWAWLVCAGAKQIENRTWSTPYRGTIAIHGSTKQDVVRGFKKELGTDLFEVNDFTYGAIIGFADIVDVQVFGREHEHDPFACGPYCWRMANPRLLRTPIAMPGKLNLFVLDEELSRQLESAETYTVDLASDSADAKIAAIMTGQPKPLKGYAYTIAELFGKLPNEQLFASAHRMVELEPDQPDGYLARIRLANWTGNADGLASDIDRVTAMCPDDLEVIVRCAEACFSTKDFARAKSLLDMLLHEMPDDDVFLSFRGSALFELGQMDDAVADLTRAIELNSADNARKSFDHATIARIYHGSGQLALAQQHADRAMELDPESAEAYCAAAMIAGGRSESSRAAALAAKALELDPQCEEALELRKKIGAT